MDDMIDSSFLSLPLNQSTTHPPTYPSYSPQPCPASPPWLPDSVCTTEQAGRSYNTKTPSEKPTNRREEEGWVGGWVRLPTCLIEGYSSQATVAYRERVHDRAGGEFI